jgi:flagellar basal-body rod modification protein FlgD
MTSVNGTTGTTLAPASNSTGLDTKTNALLGKDDFLKLMMTQLKDQDPLNPSDPSQYLSELAQMTSVEQAVNTAQSSAQSATAQTQSTALALLGHTVSYLDPSGATVSGAVQKVSFTSSGPSLTIDGVTGISPATVSEVS